MSKRTKGKWIAVDSITGGFNVVTRDRQHICRAHNAADAKLIASAPKLAKLLDDMLFLSQYYDANQLPKYGVDTIRKSRKLLNKLGMDPL